MNYRENFTCGKIKKLEHPSRICKRVDFNCSTMYKDGEVFISFVKDNDKMDKCNKALKTINSKKRMRKVKKGKISKIEKKF